MQQEVELEHGSDQADDTGGVEHQSREDREGEARERRRADAEAEEVRRSTREPPDADDLEVPRADDAARERGPGLQRKK
jgi:hypothetical protein